MRKSFIAILANLAILLPIILVYCWIVNEKYLYNWVLSVLTFSSLILCLIYWGKFKDYLKNSSIDRFISLIGLEIALLAFIQTSSQFVKSNEQFEQNRISSNNQLLATQQQLELSKQSLKDYIYATRADLIWGITKIANIDTLNSREIRLSLSNIVENKGNRDALEVEFRELIIINNKIHGGVYVNNSLDIFYPSSPQNVLFHFTIQKKDFKDYFRWIQIVFYDKELEQYFNRSICYHYYKRDAGFSFYYASKGEKEHLSRIVDEELKKNKLSLTLK